MAVPAEDAEAARALQTLDEDEDVTDEEELQLLEPAEVKVKPTIVFKDGKSQIDFVLTYEEEQLQQRLQKVTRSRFNPCPKISGITEEDREERKAKREYFLRSCLEKGLDYEPKDSSSEFDEPETYFIHCTHKALLQRAERMFLNMPLKDSEITQELLGWRERLVKKFNVKDPFEPLKPEDEHLEVPSQFTASFKYERRESFQDWDKDTFFTSAQRSAITWEILQDVRSADEREDPSHDAIGLHHLLHDNTFTTAYPLHEGPYQVKEGEKIETDRQLLYYRWARWKNWYKEQPLENIRRYFGEYVGMYFAWVGFYTTWLIPASIVGLIVFFYGLSTLSLRNNAVAADICRDENRTDYYMCPLCDERCDFWWLSDTCSFARLTLLFDNGATVFFAIFMSFWAVLFLEFWKRRQFRLQYDWDMLNYEAMEERARPEFIHTIKQHIKKAKPEDRGKFFIVNDVLDEVEYIQPAYWFYPKVIVSLSILVTMVAIVFAVIFGVFIYRIAISGLLYHLLSGINNRPTIIDFVVSITGAALQLLFIEVLNKIYEYLARLLNDWELHRTQSAYIDSLITKIYLFQSVNYYTSIFYIAFFKGKLIGYPGGYSRYGDLRLLECPTYGCLWELTIQLAIIIVGKQILNNIQELSVPSAKHLQKHMKKKNPSKDECSDEDLVPLPDLAFFHEYLELVIQYGFVTIFVAALPLTPLFALLNNIVEIRLDARKYVTIFRRPVAARVQDIGAWFAVLNIVSSIAVVTNGLLIAMTAQFIPFEVYIRGGYSDQYKNSIENSAFGNATRTGDLSGYIQWSLSPFPVSSLLDGHAFPAYSTHTLLMYDDSGNIITNEHGEPILYLPFIDFECLYDAVIENVSTSAAFFSNFSDPLTGENTFGFTGAQYACFYGGGSCSDNGTDPGQFKHFVFDVEADWSPREPTGPCANLTVPCQFRGQVNADGSRPLVFWRTWTARLVFVVIFLVFIRVVSSLLDWLVPDVPKSVLNQIKREKYLANEALYTQTQSRTPTPPKKNVESRSPTPPSGSVEVTTEVIDISEL